jgi:serine protease Do
LNHSGGSDRSAQKLLGAPGVKLRVAAVSVIALGLGAWLAPPAVPTTLSVSPERAAPLLEEQVQLREVVKPFRGVQEIADRVRRFGVTIPSEERSGVPVLDDFSGEHRSSTEAGFGVIVSETHVLTHATVVAGRESISVEAVDGTHEMRVAAYEPATGLVLLQSDSPIGTPAPLAAEAPTAGLLAAAAVSSQGRDIALPVFITTVAPDRYGVTSTGSRRLQTMPLYTLEGELLGIVGRDGPEWQAFAAGAAVQSMLARVSKGERLASFGIAFQEMTPSLQETFGEGGVLISDVVEGGPADLAGVQTGDVLTRIGDVELMSVDAAIRAVNAADIAGVTHLEVRRAGRIRRVEAAPVFAYQVSWLARHDTLDRSALEARAVFPADVLAAADIPADAHVLSVNGQVVSSRAQVDRELRRAKPPLRVLIHHGDRQFFAAVAPRR